MTDAQRAQARDFDREAIEARLEMVATVEFSKDGAVQAMCDLVKTREGVRECLREIDRLTTERDTLREALKAVLTKCPRDLAGTAWRIEISDPLYGYYTIKAGETRVAECWHGTGPFLVELVNVARAALKEPSQ